VGEVKHEDVDAGNVKLTVACSHNRATVFLGDGDDVIVLGHAGTRQAAVQEAVSALEKLVEYLQGPPPA
jgi:hypothetical protein